MMGFAFAVAVHCPAAASLPTFETAALMNQGLQSEVALVAHWTRASRDNAGLQFMIVDKVNARLFLFDGSGQLIATTAVLVGAAYGDDSPPGIGSRGLSSITLPERITPAGRFVAVAGEDITGKDVIWVDYDAAIALHRASDRKPGMGSRSRVDRLSSATPAEKRVSLGCINVAAAFYDRFIRPTFGVSTGIVYILPETRSAAVEFGIPSPGVAASATPNEFENASTPSIRLGSLSTQ